MIMSGPAFFELPQYGRLRFSGTDAQAFLHAQLTCDVAALAPGRATYGAYCTPKGRVIASFLLWRTAEGFHMQLPAPLVDPVLKQLSRYILRAKVKAEDVSADWKLFGVAGPGAAQRVASAAGGVPSKALEIFENAGVQVIHLPGDRFEVAAPGSRVQAIQEALAAGSTPAAPESWELEEIRAGIPSILSPTQDAFVPQMLNLDLLGGVSFDKGCYPGQEIVARMHYRGTLKQRLYLAHAAGTEKPQPGEKLYSTAFGEQSCGAIVNASPAPEGGFDALAVIQIAAAKGDVHWRSPSGPALELLPLPYPVDTER